MSRIIRIRVIIIFSIVFGIPGIVFGIYEKTFVDDAYDRICYQPGYGSPTSICQKVAKEASMSPGTYDNEDDITGKCEEVGVNLESQWGTPTRINFTIVFCDLGENYNACVSASSNDGVLEYFKYLPNRHSYYRCIHEGSCSL